MPKEKGDIVLFSGHKTKKSVLWVSRYSRFPVLFNLDAHLA